MGVDYSPTGGIGVKGIPIVAMTDEQLDELLSGTPYSYGLYGNAYRNGDEYIAILLRDPLEDGWGGLEKKVTTMQQWLAEHGFPTNVELISEFHIY